MQEPESEPVSVPVVESIPVTDSFEQDLNKGVTKASPNADMLFFKKILRSIVFCFIYEVELSMYNYDGFLIEQLKIDCKIQSPTFY